MLVKYEVLAGWLCTAGALILIMCIVMGCATPPSIDESWLGKAFEYGDRKH